jgi:hypothetical protein
VALATRPRLLNARADIGSTEAFCASHRQQWGETFDAHSVSEGPIQLQIPRLAAGTVGDHWGWCRTSGTEAMVDQSELRYGADYGFRNDSLLLYEGANDPLSRYNKLQTFEMGDDFRLVAGPARWLGHARPALCSH